MNKHVKKILCSIAVFSVIAAFMAGFAFGFKDKGTERYAEVNLSQK